MCGVDKLVVVVECFQDMNSEKIIAYNVPVATKNSFVEIHSSTFLWHFRNTVVDNKLITSAYCCLGMGYF